MLKQAAIEGLTQISVALIGLISAALIYYIGEAGQKIRVETKKIKDERKRKLIEAATDRLDDVTKKTITKIEQTTAKTLREAVKDGSTDRQELLDLSDQAYKEIITTLEPEYLKLLNDTLGDTRQYILNTIETAVYDLKTRS